MTPEDRGRTPATSSSANETPTDTNVVPRSGWSMTSPIGSPHRPSNTSTRPVSRSPRNCDASPAKPTIRPSLASSDGWSWKNEPIWIHPWVPLVLEPIPGSSTTTSRAMLAP